MHMAFGPAPRFVQVVHEPSLSPTPSDQDVPELLPLLCELCELLPLMCELLPAV